ncbi:MAG TPA: hypothetical protein DCL44_01235 [Elusimicrobia bacterium]|nr:hypothetical protein [Elusimicrobiota bacterium]
MGAMAMNLLVRLVDFFKDMVTDINIIYLEKGIEPFKKPVFLALPLLFFIYIAIYSPLTAKVTLRLAELTRFAAISQNYQEYTDARGQLLAYQSKLPLFKDKDAWLSHIITTTAKKNGLAFDSLSAQTEMEFNGLLIVSRGVTLKTTYPKLAAWLADIENSPIFLKVTEINFMKQDGSVGMIQAKFTISTVFPRSSGSGSARGRI